MRGHSNTCSPLTFKNSLVPMGQHPPASIKKPSGEATTITECTGKVDDSITSRRYSAYQQLMTTRERLTRHALPRASISKRNPFEESGKPPQVVPPSPSECEIYYQVSGKHVPIEVRERRNLSVADTGIRETTAFQTTD